MVIDCQVCGAQQRLDDSVVAAAGGQVTCRSCGATIKVGMSASADDDDIPTRVGATPARRSAPGPIPLAGSDGVGVPVPDFDLDALTVGSALPPPARSVFTEPTSPALRVQGLRVEEEPIPLLDGDDLLDIDSADEAETTPGISLADVAQPGGATRSAGFSFSAPVPLPTSAPAAPAAPAKTLSFLEELPPVPSMSPHETTTRFNRNFNDDDLPGIGEQTVPTSPAFSAPRSPPAPTRAPPPPAPARAPTPPQALSMASEDLPAAYDPSSFDLPTAYEPPPALPEPEGDLPQWAAVEGAQVTVAPVESYSGLDFDSADLPSPAGTSDLGSDLPTSYTGTPYTSSGYGSLGTEPTADSLPSDFADLPPLEGAGLPSELPPPPPDLMADFPPLPPDAELSMEPGIELDTDLPTPSSYGSASAMEHGVVLNDDLPTPAMGESHNDTIGLDLPTPHAGFEMDDSSVPNLMDAPPPVMQQASITQQQPVIVKGGDDTVVVRDKRKRADDDENPRKKSKAAPVAVLGVLVLAGLGFVSYRYPELLPVRMPWAKDAGTTVATTDPAKPTTDAKPTTAVTPEKGATTTTTAAGTDAVAEEAHIIPELSPANVNQLDYATLRDATQLLTAGGKAANGPQHELAQWSRFRMAYFFGDTKARDELLADAPVMSPTATELAAATAIGVQVMQKPAVARKNLERLVGAGPGPANKARFKDSVALLTLLGATSDKQPMKAIQAYDRALVVDPKALDARIGRIVAMLAIPKPQQRTQAVSAATALVKSESSPSIAMKLAPAVIAAGAASAMADITAPIQTMEQLADLPPSMAPVFTKLLAHRAAISGDFVLAKRAAEQAQAGAPEDLVAAMNVARLTAAGGGDPAAVLTETRSHVRDVESKAALIDEQVKLSLAYKDTAAAKKALASASDLAPRPAMPFVKLGEARIALADGKNELALKNATMAAKARPKTFEARLIAINAGKLPAPAELAQLTALAKAASNADVDARLGKAMADRTNHGGAAELYARALWRDPIVSDPLSATLALADALDRSGAGDRAETLLLGLRTNVPTDERLGAALLAHAKRHGNGAVAVEFFQSASDKNPKDVALTLQLARALVEADKAGEAQVILDGLVHTPEGAKSPDVMRELARAWMSRDSVKARGYVNDSIRLRADAQSYQLLGEIEESQSKLDDAMDAYRKAIKLDSTLTEARVRLARAQVQRGQWQDAATQLRDIIQHEPGNIQAMELLGDAMRDVGKPREALVWYKKALDITPDSGTLMMKFARLQLQDLAAVQPAVKSFRQILQVHPDLAEAHYYLGYALKDLGRTGEAKSELEQYLKARPDGEFAAEVKNDLQDLASQ